MKTKLYYPLFCLLFVGLASISLNAATSSQSKSDGTWTSASWDNTPAASNGLYINHSISLDDNIGSTAFGALFIGSTLPSGSTASTEGTLEINAGGNLTVTSVTMTRNLAAAVNGTLILNGGQLTSTGAVNMGTGTSTAAGSSSKVTIKANSKFSASNIIIGSTATNQTANFTIEGSGSTITSTTGLTVNGTNASLEFKFDTSGISVLTLATNLQVLNNGKIVIDGSAYRGGSDIFTLVEFTGAGSTSLSSAFGAAIIAGIASDNLGFGLGYTLSLNTSDTKKFVLEVTQIPEPSTYALIFGSMVFLSIIRLRRKS